MEEPRQYEYDHDKIPEKPDTKFDKFLDKIGDWFVVTRSILCIAIIIAIIIIIIRWIF